MTDRRVCTLEYPYDKSSDDGYFWIHPSAISTHYTDVYEAYDCPVCGLSFKVELGD